MVRRAGRNLKKRVVRLFGVAKQRFAARRAARALEKMDSIAREFAVMPTPKELPHAHRPVPSAKPTPAEEAAAAHLSHIAELAGRAMVTIPRETRRDTPIP